MAPPTWTARADGWRVELLRDGVVAGSGRWTGDAIVECTVSAHPGDPAREAALLRQLAVQIAAATDAALAAAPPEKNEDGVDLPLLDYMLGMTPDDRLRTLQNWLDTFGPFVEVNATN